MNNKPTAKQILDAATKAGLTISEQEPKQLEQGQKLPLQENKIKSNGRVQRDQNRGPWTWLWNLPDPVSASDQRLLPNVGSGHSRPSIGLAPNRVFHAIAA